MAKSLAIEIQDSEGFPRCCVYWSHSGEESSTYALALSYGISSLNDDSTTEDILRVILDAYPNAGIPRERMEYSYDGKTLREYPFVTEYADSLEIPQGTYREGLIAISNNMIDYFCRAANNVMFLMLGHVSACDCVYDVDLNEYFCLDDYEEGTDEYDRMVAHIEDVKAHAVSMTDDFFLKMSTHSMWEYYTDVFHKNTWLRYGNAYYHIMSKVRR